MSPAGSSQLQTACSCIYGASFHNKILHAKFHKPPFFDSPEGRVLGVVAATAASSARPPPTNRILHGDCPNNSQPTKPTNDGRAEICRSQAQVQLLSSELNSKLVPQNKMDAVSSAYGHDYHVPFHFLFSHVYIAIPSAPDIFA